MFTTWVHHVSRIVTCWLGESRCFWQFACNICRFSCFCWLWSRWRKRIDKCPLPQAA